MADFSMGRRLSTMTLVLATGFANTYALKLEDVDGEPIASEDYVVALVIGDETHEAELSDETYTFHLTAEQSVSDLLGKPVWLTISTDEETAPLMRGTVVRA